MLVGHLPFMEKLAARLVTGKKKRRAVTFEKGGVLCLEPDEDTEADEGEWTVRWYLTPSLLQTVTREEGPALQGEREAQTGRSPMKIGIIGAGQIGGTLARRFRELGHDVFVANSRSPDTLEELVQETGATPVWPSEAARSGEVVVVTIPEAAVRELPDDLFEGVSDDVVVVDTCNYYPRHRDGQIDPIEEGKTESRWVSDRLGRPVVKAFNNIRAQHLLEMGRPKGDPDRIALPVAADRERDKRVVMELVDELGFDPVDAGTIDESWRQEPGAPVYGADLDANGVRRTLSEASPGRMPQFSATDESPGSFTDPA